MAAPLDLQVFTSGPQAFSATSSLVSGARDAALIDAQFTLSEAHRLAAVIYERGKRLTTIYVTHGHPDHYFGLTVLKQAFPGARVVTAREVLGVINETAAAKVAQWKPLYGDNIPVEPVLPEALKGDVIELEGEDVRILHVGQGDVEHSTVVCAVVAGHKAPGRDDDAAVISDTPASTCWTLTRPGRRCETQMSSSVP